VTVGLVAMVSMAMTGCSSTPDADYDGVCVDTTTQRRIDDEECRNGGGHAWRYYPRGSSVPALGSPASGGTSTVPDGLVAAKGGAPAEGGAISRGGFGGGGEHGVGG
jgi:hypothetical protein